jgi:hypothetical protein
MTTDKRLSTRRGEILACRKVLKLPTLFSAKNSELKNKDRRKSGAIFRVSGFASLGDQRTNAYGSRISYLRFETALRKTPGFSQNAKSESRYLDCYERLCHLAEIRIRNMITITPEALKMERAGGIEHSTS